MLLSRMLISWGLCILTNVENAIVVNRLVHFAVPDPLECQAQAAPECRQGSPCFIRPFQAVLLPGFLVKIPVNKGLCNPQGQNLEASYRVPLPQHVLQNPS